MHTQGLSLGIVALVPYWVHILVHAALIGWYFFVKSRWGRWSHDKVARMFVPGIWVSCIHAVFMALNAAAYPRQGYLGLLISVLFIVLFLSRWAQARADALP